MSPSVVDSFVQFFVVSLHFGQRPEWLEYASDRANRAKIEPIDSYEYATRKCAREHTREKWAGKRSSAL